MKNPFQGCGYWFLHQQHAPSRFLISNIKMSDLACKLWSTIYPSELPQQTSFTKQTLLTCTSKHVYAGKTPRSWCISVTPYMLWTTIPKHYMWIWVQLNANAPHTPLHATPSSNETPVRQNLTSHSYYPFRILQHMSKQLIKQLINDNKN